MYTNNRKYSVNGEDFVFPNVLNFLFIAIIFPPVLGLYCLAIEPAYLNISPVQWMVFRIIAFTSPFVAVLIKKHYGLSAVSGVAINSVVYGLLVIAGTVLGTLMNQNSILMEMLSPNTYIELIAVGITLGYVMGTVPYLLIDKLMGFIMIRKNHYKEI